MTRIIAPLALVASVLTLAACGKTDKIDYGSAAPQIAARVNGNEISVQQVTRVIELGEGIMAPRRQTAAQALEQLIDQELLVEKALAVKLDREPQVMQAIAAEKRRILGLAYLERAVPPAPKHSPEDIRKFFVDNPALFERRRIYQIHELLAVVPADKKPLLKAEIAKARQLDDIANWFKSQSLSFNEIASIRPAEQIPLEILLRVAEMKDAQVAMFVAPDKVSVLELVHAEDAPLSEPQAAPVIEQLLTNHWRLELARKEVKQLREAAKIEYLGQFDTIGAGTPAPRRMPPNVGKLLTSGEAARSHKGLSGRI